MKAAVVWVVAATCASAAGWTRLASPNFELYTDSGERSARQVLARFEQARRVLGEGREDPGFPARVLLLNSARDYATLRPAANVPGFFQSGPERDYIVMYAGAELDRIILHEYTHLVLNHSSMPLPQWLEEGLAELYSTMSIGDGRAVVGAPVAEHVVELRRGPWLSAARLAGVKQNSPEYNEAGKTGIFYAQSWALTHMLSLGSAYRGKLPGFIAALGSGTPPDAAFEAAFGKTLEAALSDLERYTLTGFRTLEIDTIAASEIVYSEVAPLDPAEAEQSRGEVLLLMGRDVESRRVYEQIAKRYPSSAAAQTGLAVIAMHDHDLEAARRCFERALALGARDGSTYFEYAMLLRDTGAAPDVVDRLLTQAVAANPALAEAHFLLGVRASDAGRYSEAIEHLRRSVQVLPRQAYLWEALVYAYHRSGRLEEAKVAAAKALLCAATPHEAEMARNARKLIEERAAETKPRGAAVITPESWKNPQGDRTISGQLTEVDCAERAARLHVKTADGEMLLEVADPRRVVIRGGPVQRTLACGPQAAVSIQVEFIAATGQVTALEFQ